MCNCDDYDYISSLDFYYDHDDYCDGEDVYWCYFYFYYYDYYDVDN